MIPYGRQDISPEDIDAVTEVLRSDWLTQGQAGPTFESALASYLPMISAAVFFRGNSPKYSSMY